MLSSFIIPLPQRPRLALDVLLHFRRIVNLQEFREHLFRHSVLLWKHSDFATKTHPFIPLILSALLMHIQAYHDPINDPRY
jgi:hypothetical protein